MDYEKLYKEALERARTIRFGNPNSATANVVCEEIFPELRDSEDEKIKKGIVKFLKENKDFPEDWISWLEKQGVHKPVPFKAEHGKYYYCIRNYFSGGKKWASKGDVVQALRGLPIMGLDDASEFFLPVNNMQFNKIVNRNDIPKFKVGDWVVNKQDEIARINQVKEDSYGTQRYYIEFTDGTKTDPMPCFADEEFHLWTIQDAKDGDVLVIENGRRNDECFSIFKDIADREVLEHCYYRTSDNIFSPTGSFIGYLDNVYHPATKEQRDFLFQKMNEAGYEWDADEKTLVMIGIDNDEEDERHEELMEDDETSIKQNPSWSKEDEEMFNGCLIDLRYLVDNGRKCNKELYLNEIKWLKGIKDRVQPQQKQEWGKSDKNMLEAVIDVFFNNTMSGSKGREVYSKEIDWLKSLKDRVQLHWKPTDEQMEMLKETIEYDAPDANLVVLNSLYNDLKKL